MNVGRKNLFVQWFEIVKNNLVVLEIEQRKQFIDQMNSLGKRKEYQQVISNEISDVSIINIDQFI